MNRLLLIALTFSVAAVPATIWALSNIYSVKGVGSQIVRSNGITGAVSVCVQGKCFPMEESNWSTYVDRTPKTVPTNPIEAPEPEQKNDLLDAIRADEAAHGPWNAYQGANTSE